MIVKLKPDSDIGKLYHLSINKEYVAVKKDRLVVWYEIKCDDGLKREFSSVHFISVEEIRDKKLNDLGL